MATLIFDLETQLLADDVGGWDNISKMKLAGAVTHNLETGQFTRYREADVEALLADLRAATLVVGFNVLRFDYEVLRPYAGGQALQLPTVDMLVDIQKNLGFRLSLGSLAAGTLNQGKSADGLLAVQWFREGKIDQLLDYCQQDVVVTRDLYAYGRQNKCLKYRDKYGKVKLVAVKW
jgi:DEAD/DEAH box helicase domain-containing protein